MYSIKCIFKYLSHIMKIFIIWKSHILSGKSNMLYVIIYFSATICIWFMRIKFIHSFIHYQLAYTIPGVVLSSITFVTPPIMYTIHLLIKLHKKGALDSQPQVIKFTSCLLMFGGSLDLLSTGILNPWCCVV